ncbi:MAG: hypothetical protein IKN72_06170 [Clostridia bacterium]|nr:hypothetical protein [Clostridia bacterium]
MATKSFYKTISFNSQKSCRNLVSALEKAKVKKGKNVTISKPVKKVSRDQLKEFFSG